MADEKKTKKLSKVPNGTVLTITEGITGTVLTYDLADLSDKIKGKLLMHGFSQKLGDAASGKEGQEAIDAIVKVYEGLMKGDFTVRVPAAEKVNVKSLAAKISAMEDGDMKDMYTKALRDLGVKI